MTCPRYTLSTLASIVGRTELRRQRSLGDLEGHGRPRRAVCPTSPALAAWRSPAVARSSGSRSIDDPAATAVEHAGGLADEVEGDRPGETGPPGGVLVADRGLDAQHGVAGLEQRRRWRSRTCAPRSCSGRHGTRRCLVRAPVARRARRRAGSASDRARRISSAASSKENCDIDSRRAAVVRWPPVAARVSTTAASAVWNASSGRWRGRRRRVRGSPIAIRRCIRACRDELSSLRSEDRPGRG